MISTYNNPQPYTMQNLPLIVRKSLSLHGFTLLDFLEKYREQFYAEFPKMVKDGRIKYTEDVSEGLQNAGEAILDVQMGRNKGKKIVMVAYE